MKAVLILYCAWLIVNPVIKLSIIPFSYSFYISFEHHSKIIIAVGLLHSLPFHQRLLFVCLISFSFIFLLSLYNNSHFVHQSSLIAFWHSLFLNNK
jgi:hypothetical protein